MTPCQQGPPTSLHFLSPGVARSCNLTGGSALKTPLFGDQDTEFEKPPLTAHSVQPNAPQTWLPHRLTQMVWSEVRFSRVTPRALGSR